MKHWNFMVGQTKLFFIRNYVILLSFLLPVILLEISYVNQGIFPFGNKGILIIDLYHQYAPFISGLQEKLRTFSSLLYSWSGGLGTSFLPLYSYYLASPLNLITVLFPKEYLTEAILVLTMLKVGLAGACFSYYLKGIHHEKNLITVAFSLLYALSAYVLVFSWNIMWMDTIYLLPLIMLGLVNIVRDGKGLFYCITLTITLLSNFYMAFFLCLFTFLYFPVCFFKYNKLPKPAQLIKKTVRFAGFSLLSVGLSSVLLLPTYFALKLTSAAKDAFPKTLTNYFDLFDYITRHFTAASPSIRDGMPNLYCGIVVLILIPVYFLCKGICLKEKLWHLALLLILIASFNINMPNFIWDGFHYPNQILYRYSFVYIFLILSMSYEAYKRLHELSDKEIGIICLSVLGLILVSQKFDDLSLDYLTIYISVISIILYAVVFAVNRYNNIKPVYKVLLLIIVVAAEILINAIIIDNVINSKEGYMTRDGYSSGKEIDQVRDKISEIAKEDTSFYRIGILPPKTTNDPFLYNYRGVSLFSSTAPEKPVKMMQNLGYRSNSINSYEYGDSTAILDSLFDVRYLIYRNVKIDKRLYIKTSAADGVTVFQNPYALPPGFQVPDEMKKFSSNYGSNPFIVQNNLMQGISGCKDILVPLEQKQETQDNLTFSNSGPNYYYTRTKKDMDSYARIVFTIDKDQEVYLYYKAPSGMKGTGQITVDNKKIDFNPKASSIIDLGFCKSGIKAKMQIYFEKSSPDSGTFSVFDYGLNQPAFINAISLIRKKLMTIDSFTDTGISGHIDPVSDGQMLMTIPYDKGWHVKVDNHEVETYAFDDCLLAFELPKGPHKIELHYIPDKFFAGLSITIVSFFILLLVFLKKQGVGFFKTKHRRLEGLTANG